MRMIFFSAIFSLAFYCSTAQSLSGVYYCATENEQLELSSSEYFEAISPNVSTYGLWMVEDNRLQLFFAQYGTALSFEITSFKAQSHFTVKTFDEETGAIKYDTYRYIKPASEYHASDVQLVLNEFQRNLRQNAQMQQKIHEMNMGIINNIGGNNTEYVVKDEYGNVIRKY